MKTLAERVAIAEKNSVAITKYHYRELLREAMDENERLRGALEHFADINNYDWDGAVEGGREIACKALGKSNKQEMEKVE
jgi:hypothetical protein